MTEHETLQEYTFIDRRPNRSSLQEAPGEAEVAPSPLQETAGAQVSSRKKQRHKKPLRGAVFVLAVQTVLALLLVVGAAAVRLIGGDFAKQVTDGYRYWMEQNELDLKALITPIAPQEPAESAEPAPTLSEQEPTI